MNRQEAKRHGVEIGKLSASKDSQGHYELKEDGRIVAEGWYDNAAEIKSDYIEGKVGDRAEWDF